MVAQYVPSRSMATLAYSGVPSRINFNNRMVWGVCKQPRFFVVVVDDVVVVVVVPFV